MLKDLLWLIQFKRNLNKMKKHYLFIISATKKDFAHYQSQHVFTDYQQEEIEFHLNRMQDFYTKIDKMGFFQASITQNKEFQSYIGLFKKNLLSCNEILMLGARRELLLFSQDMDFLINNKTHNLFIHLSPEIQNTFKKIYDLTNNAIKSIDEKNLLRFAECKYTLDLLLTKIHNLLSPQKYDKLFQELTKLQEHH